MNAANSAGIIPAIGISECHIPQITTKIGTAHAGMIQFDFAASAMYLIGLKSAVGSIRHWDTRAGSMPVEAVGLSISII